MAGARPAPRESPDLDSAARAPVLASRSRASSTSTGISGPVIFAANHQSHFDMPVILRRCRRDGGTGVAPAMAKEFFKAHFYPDRVQLAGTVHEQR